MNLREGDTCPACKEGRLIRKSGRYGEFIGCDLYRSGCNYILREKSASKKSSLEIQADNILRANHKEHLIL